MATFYVNNVDIGHLRQWLNLAHSELRFHIDGQTHISLENGHFLKIVTNWETLDNLKLLPGASDLTAIENLGVIAREGWVENGKVCWLLPEAILRYSLTPLGSERVKFAVEITRNELKPYFDWIIKKLLEDYPGTAVSKQPENNPQKLKGPQISALGEKISEVFNEDELRDLTRKFSIDYENLPGDNKLRKAHELVENANRNRRVSELLGILREERPRETWSIETGD